MSPPINGDLHLVLVVKDAERNAEWYCRVFGFVVGRQALHSALPDRSGGAIEFACTTLFHVSSRLFLGLAQPVGRSTEAFDLCHAGLQHFGFHVNQRSELDEWTRHLDGLGIEHSTVLPEGPGLLVRFHDPDMIPVEYLLGRSSGMRNNVCRSCTFPRLLGPGEAATTSSHMRSIPGHRRNGFFREDELLTVSRFVDSMRDVS